MKQTIIGFVIGAVIGGGVIWAFGPRRSADNLPKESRILSASAQGGNPAMGPKYMQMLAFDSTRGSDPGTGPRFTTPGLPAGSALVITCVDKDCQNSGGPGTGASVANSNILLELPIPNGLPANMQMLMSYRLAIK